MSVLLGYPRHLQGSQNMPITHSLTPFFFFFFDKLWTWIRFDHAFITLYCVVCVAVHCWLAVCNVIHPGKTMVLYQIKVRKYWDQKSIEVSMHHEILIQWYSRQHGEQNAYNMHAATHLLMDTRHTTLVTTTK